MLGIDCRAGDGLAGFQVGYGDVDGPALLDSLVPTELDAADRDNRRDSQGINQRTGVGDGDLNALYRSYRFHHARAGS